VKHKCEGSMYPQGGAFDKPRRGVKVRCPYCHKEYSATFRPLGPRNSGYGYESYVPNHWSQTL
jgi:hypothetical protein